jgi:hypothetical protein
MALDDAFNIRQFGQCSKDATVVLLVSGTDAQALIAGRSDSSS